MDAAPTLTGLSELYVSRHGTPSPPAIAKTPEKTLRKRLDALALENANRLGALESKSETVRDQSQTTFQLARQLRQQM